MESHDPDQVHPQRLHQAIWQQGHTILCTFAVPDVDLPSDKIDILDSKRHTLRNPKPRAIHQLCHQQRRASHAGQRGLDLLRAENYWDPMFPLDPLQVRNVTQGLLNDRFVQKNYRIECLRLCRR